MDAPKQHIILDTNIWLYTTKLLSDPVSAALLFHLHTTGGKLVLPEIVEKEILINLAKVSRDSCRAIDKQFSILQRLLGTVDDYRLPSDADISQCFPKRASELADLIVKVPFSFSHAKGALKRILEGTPPNKPSNQKQQGDQQFKDSCIWEVALEVSKKEDVVLISKDSGFFENRNYDKGLAKSLSTEATKHQGSITIFSDIQSFLTDIKDKTPGLDKALIRRVLYEEMENNTTVIDSVGVEQLRVLSEIAFKAFLTEKHNKVAIYYKLQYEIQSIEDSLTGEPLGPGVMLVHGNFLFDLSEKKLISNSIDEIGFKDRNGLPVAGKGATTFARMSATIGRGKRDLKFQSEIREKFSEP